MQEEHKNKFLSTQTKFKKQSSNCQGKPKFQSDEISGSINYATSLIDMQYTIRYTIWKSSVAQ